MKVRRHAYNKLNLAAFIPSLYAMDKIDLPRGVTAKEIARAARAVIDRAEEAGDYWRVGLCATWSGRWSILLAPLDMVDDTAETAPRTLH